MKFSDVPVLMYHEIGNQDNQWSVSVGEFEKQMQYLQENGYKTISLTELNQGIEENRFTDEKLVVITFDDARRGVYTDGFPVLRKFGFTATIFVVPTWVDGENPGDLENYSKFMSWDELRKLANSGFEVGSHTNSHRNLVKVNENVLFEEISNAEKRIRQKLGIEVQHFSYPYGEFDQRSLDLVKSKYKTTLTITKGFSKEKGKLARQWVQHETSLDLFKKLLQKPTLSVCMIVKNEEKFLEQCLKSVKDLADEIVIVDTGSTDQTKEIAGRFTDMIIDFQWCDDFSAARNESLKHATSDWILVLDADEVIDDKDLGLIRQAMNEWAVSGYNIMTQNYSNDSSIKRWQPCQINKPLAKSFQGWFPSVKVRLFQNKQEIKFQGRMHEMISEKELEKHGKVTVLRVPIHHYGASESSKGREKTKKYLELTKKKIEENPQNAKAYFELGIQYKNSNQFAEAENAFEQSLTLDADPTEPLLNLALVQQKQGKLDLAIANYNKVLEKNAQLSDAYFGLGFCYFKRNDLAKSREYFEKATIYNPNYLDAHINLGAIYERSNEMEKAVSSYTSALKLNPRNARVYYNLGVLHEKMMNVEAAVKCYEKAIELDYFRKDWLEGRVGKMKKFLDKSIK